MMRPANQNCFNCQHSRTLPGDCHLSCENKNANVIGSSSGIRNGWFNWPYNFDPLWLRECDGFAAKEDRKQ